MRDLHGPVAASVFAGLLGAGLIDVLVTVARADGPAPFGSLAAAGDRALRRGRPRRRRHVERPRRRGDRRHPRRLARDPLRRRARPRDRQPASSRRWSRVRGAGDRRRRRPAAARRQDGEPEAGDDRLGRHGPAGVAAGRAPSRSAIYPTLRAPRRAPAAPGTAWARRACCCWCCSAPACSAASFALSRADWRVLDLGPLVALALAAVLGAGHGLFWYRTEARRRAGAAVRRAARSPLELGAVAVVIVALALGSRAPESSAALEGGRRRLARPALRRPRSRARSPTTTATASRRASAAATATTRAPTSTPAPTTSPATASTRTARAATRWRSPSRPSRSRRRRHRRPRAAAVARRPSRPRRAPARARSRATSSSSPSTPSAPTGWASPATGARRAAR